MLDPFLSSLLRIVLAIALILGALIGVLVWQFSMPGRSHSGPLPPLTAGQAATRDALRRHVVAIASRPHHVSQPEALAASAAYLESALRGLGYPVDSQFYEVEGVRVRNLEVAIAGSTRRGETIVLGAHYDSSGDGPGANDNGSGSAALLELARLLRNEAPARTLRLAWLVNEEPPYFQGDDMGSVRYARLATSRRNERVVAMLSLETMGYYDDAPGSQRYPHKLMRLFYPDAGNFVAFLGNWKSRDLVRDSVAAFRAAVPFPSQGLALPDDVPAMKPVSDPLGYSDHWSFWQVGVPALMVTDTAFERYDHYHTPNDTPDRIDYDRLARVTHGLVPVVQALATAAMEPSG